MKTRIAQIMKTFGIMAILVAFAAAAFPAQSFAYPAQLGGVDYGKAVITVLAASDTISDSKPIAGATAELVNASGVTVSKHSTNSNGQFSLAAAGGSYKVRVSAPGYQLGGDYLDIKNGQTSYLTIRLQPLTTSLVSGPTPVPASDPLATPVPSAGTGKAEITVVSAQPGLLGGLQGVAGATVVILDVSGAALAKQATDSFGQIRTELAEGTYKISISADGYQANSAELTIKAGQVTYLSVQLSPAK
jgi:hypothetical protein